MSIFGGGKSSSQSSSDNRVTVNTTSNVGVNVDVDLDPIAKLTAELAGMNKETVATITAANSAVTSKVVEAVSKATETTKALVDGMQQSTKDQLMLGVAGLALMYFGTRK